MILIVYQDKPGIPEKAETRHALKKAHDCCLRNTKSYGSKTTNKGLLLAAGITGILVYNNWLT